MELNWTTFVLEIINFLILVWVLKKLLYQPVLNAIEQRRKNIEATLTQATNTRNEAQTMREQYENRLAAWEHDKQQAQDELLQEIAAERKRRLEDLQRELIKERTKAEAIAAQHQQESQRQTERRALERSARFASKLLRDVSDANLDTRLVNHLIEDLRELPEEKLTELRQAGNTEADTVSITTAHPLADDTRQLLETALIHALGSTQKKFNYLVDPNLLAGARITIGDWLIKANLQDELAWFVSISGGNNES